MRKITDIKIAGKWYEFRFADGDQEGDFDNCCKVYMFEELLDHHNLSEHALKHGRVGLWVDWPASSDRPLSVHKKAKDEAETANQRQDASDSIGQELVERLRRFAERLRND